MLISVGSVKGSPGATTFAALLARMWPAEGYTEPARMLLEADADGASLAALWHEALGTTVSPGLIEFAAASRGGTSMVNTIGASSQPIGAEVELVPGVANRNTMASVLSSLGDAGLAELAAFAGLVVADVGRFRPPVASLIRRSQLTVVVCRPTLADAQLLAPVVAELGNAGAKVGVVTVGDKPYSAAAVAEAVGVPETLAWSVPFEKQAGRVLADRGPAHRAMLRSRLGRRVRTIAADIATHCAPVIAAEAEPQKRAVLGEMADTDVASSSFGEVVGRG